MFALRLCNDDRKLSENGTPPRPREVGGTLRSDNGVTVVFSTSTDGGPCGMATID